MTGTERRLAPDPQGAIGSAGPPAAVRYLRYLTYPVERLLDRIFGSKWNPFYQSGNLAVLSFLVSLASGLVLFLWYHIADPHGSVLAIQESVPGGAWLRPNKKKPEPSQPLFLASATVRSSSPCCACSASS